MLGFPEDFSTIEVFYTIIIIIINTSTTEIRKPKRSHERKLAYNIKMTARGFLHNVRSKPKVCNKVGTLGDNAQNIISGFLMVEDINGYFSSVFTREDMSSLPIPDAKFQEAESDYLGQLIVTPEMAGKK